MARRSLTAAAVAASFIGLLALFGWLAVRGTVTLRAAVAMGIATFGLYVGFGVLIAVYRLVNKLD